MKKIAYIISFFFLSITSFSCQQLPETNIPDNIQGMLLYIEDLDGKDGNYSWDFGDLVAYDPETNQKFILTSNSYLDLRPSYSSKLNKVIFESERYKESAVIGILGKANIYTLDLKTKSTDMITDEEFKNKFKEVHGNRVDFNLFSTNFFNEIFLFSIYLKRNYHSVYSYNITTGILKTVMKEIHYFANYNYDSEENIFYYEKYENPDNEFYDLRKVSIVKLDIQSGKVDSIIISDNSANYLEDIRSEVILYEEVKDEKHTLYAYDMRKKKVLSETDWNFMENPQDANPVFGKSTDEIYFIKEPINNDKDYKCDIYWMNLKTKEIKQITTDGHIKNDLTFCR